MLNFYKFFRTEDNKATLFWDEIDNQDIKKEEAKKVLDTADNLNLLS